MVSVKMKADACFRWMGEWMVLGGKKSGQMRNPTNIASEKHEMKETQNTSKSRSGSRWRNKQTGRCARETKDEMLVSHRSEKAVEGEERARSWREAVKLKRTKNRFMREKDGCYLGQ
jgi:hypothetical protein